MTKKIILGLTLVGMAVGAAHAGGIKCIFCKGTGFNGNFSCAPCKGTGKGLNY